MPSASGPLVHTAGRSAAAAAVPAALDTPQHTYMPARRAVSVAHYEARVASHREVKTEV